MTTAYAAGLAGSRRSQGSESRMSTSGRGVILVRPRQGARRTCNADAVAAASWHPCARHWRLCQRPKTFLFPGRDDAHSIDPNRAARSLPVGGRNHGGGADVSALLCIRCATASRRICWRTEPTSGSSRFCSATTICRRRRATRRSATHTIRATQSPFDRLTLEVTPPS